MYYTGTTITEDGDCRFNFGVVLSVSEIEELLRIPGSPSQENKKDFLRFIIKFYEQKELEEIKFIIKNRIKEKGDRFIEYLNTVSDDIDNSMWSKFADNRAEIVRRIHEIYELYD